MRLYVFVEGQTEEAFVKQLVAPHLMAHGIMATTPRLLGGGFWKTWKRDIGRVLGEQRGPAARFTTLFDLYGLPRGFPGGAKLRAIADTRRRAAAVEEAVAAAFGDERLLPYVQRHEFEALVLAALDMADWIFDGPGQAAGLAALRAELAGRAPEEVNDGVQSAPSKRLSARIPGYDKVLHGEMATTTLGLPALRKQCPGFDGWLARLERLAAPGGR